MSEWESFRIKDFGKVVTGKTPPTVDKEFYNKGYKFVTPTDLDFNSYYIRHTQREVSEKARNRYPNYFLPPDSVSYTCIGATIGKSCLNREYVLTNQQINSIIPNKSSNARFIYYYLNAITPSIVAVAGGAATPIVNKSSFESIKINVPPLPTQQKIAKILSNYDDLIENNLKRIKLLEESARLTYEEWFLRFRVDGKKLDIDAATNLPFGWEYSGLNNISTFTNGYAFKSKDFVEYGHPVIKIKNIDGKMVDVHNTNRISANDVLKVNDKFKLHEGDLLIAMTGATVGKLGFVPYSNDACYLNQRVGKIQSEYLFFTFLALSGTSGQKQILNFAGGAAQPNISGDQILAVKNIIPAKDILDKFELLSNNALSQILNFTRKNQLLKEARDILLPRLMTGMIDTDDMDIAV